MIPCPSCQKPEVGKLTYKGELVGWVCRACKWGAPLLPEVRKVYKQALDWALSKRAN